MRYHLTLVRTAIIKIIYKQQVLEGWGEKGTLLHCWRGCKLVLPLSRTAWRFLRKLNVELLYDPVIPLLGIYPDKTVNSTRYMHLYFHSSTIYKSQDMKTTQRFINRGMDKENAVCVQTHTHMCACTHTCIHTYNGLLLSHSAIEKNEIMPFAATRMQLEIIILSDVSQKEKDKYHKTSLIYGI